MPVAGLDTFKKQRPLRTVIASGTIGAMLANIDWNLEARAQGIERADPAINR